MYNFIFTDYQSTIVINADTLEQAEYLADQSLDFDAVLICFN